MRENNDHLFGRGPLGQFTVVGRQKAIGFALPISTCAITADQNCTSFGNASFSPGKVVIILILAPAIDKLLPMYSTRLKV